MAWQLQQQVNIPITWDEKEVQALGAPKSVTTAVFQPSPGGKVVMTFGYVVPPMFCGTPESQMEQAKSLKRGGI